MPKKYSIFLCSYDFVKIVYKINHETRLLEKSCGDKTGESSQLLVGEVAVLTFHTDHKNQKEGFHIIFEFTPDGKTSSKVFVNV